MLGFTMELWDTIEIHGDWNIPNQPKVSGTLFYNPSDGFRLKLLSYLDANDPGFFPPHRDEPAPFVHGIDIGGQKYTLYNVQLGESVARWEHKPGFYDYHVEAVFIGKQFTTQAEMQFSSIKLRMHGLEEWYGYEFFKHIPRTDTYSIALEASPTFDVPAIDAKVWVDSSVNIQGGGPKHRSIEQKNAILLSSNTAKDNLWFDPNYWYLYQLMTLLIGKPTYLTSIVYRPHPPGHPSDTHELIQYVTRQSAKPDVEEYKYNHALVPYKMLPSFGDIVNTWFAKKEIYQIPVSLMLGAMSGRSGFIENNFIGLMTALECFVDRRYGRDIASYEARGTVVSKKMEDHYLKHRVHYALSKLAIESQAVFAADIAKLSERIVSIRNQITHPSEERTRYTAQEFYWHVERLKAMLFLLLLKDVGVDEANLRESLMNHYEYYNILRSPYDPPATP